MNKEKIIKKLQKEKLIVIKEGIFQYPALCKYDQKFNCFVIEVNQNIVNKEDAIFHELAHIIRGDLFIDPKNINPTIANMSMDLIINSILGIEKLVYEDGTEIPGVYEKTFYQQFPDAPDWKLGWEAIYNYLAQKVAKNQLENFLIDFEPCNIDNQEIIEKINQAIKEIRKKILKELSQTEDSQEDGDAENKKMKEKMKEKIKDLLKSQIQNTIQSMSHNSGTGSGSNFVIPEPKPEPYLIRLLKKALRIGTNGEKAIKRTYRRESVIPNFAKRMPLPSVSILFVVDVSGSYIDIAKDHILPAIVFLAKYKIKPKLIIFDDQVYEINLKNPKWIGGGGTKVKPVFEWLKKQGKTFDTIIFISDYEFFDFENDKREVAKILKKFSKKVYTLDWEKIKNES